MATGRKDFIKALSAGAVSLADVMHENGYSFMFMEDLVGRPA